MTSSTEPADPESVVRFFFEDPDDTLAGVRLHQEIARPRTGPELVRFVGSKGWLLYFPRPDVGRMEYQFELIHRDGGTELVLDPGNPLTAPGPFGDKSVVEFPEYKAPSWWDPAAPVGGAVQELELPARGLGARMRARLWTSAGATAEDVLPLLVAHDGADYAAYSSLLQFLDHFTSAGRLPPLRAALLQPLHRDQDYSASAAYARALVHDVIPALAQAAPLAHGRRMRVGMGASLGGLAMLHAHRTSPAAFGGLFLQSGSYFRQRTDAQESGFARFRRVSRFTGRVLTAREWAHPIRATISCGTVEENLANNVSVRDALVDQGYDVRFEENRDAHNWIAWRDTFDPHLLDLLTELWG